MGNKRGFALPFILAIILALTILYAGLLWATGGLSRQTARYVASVQAVYDAESAIIAALSGFPDGHFGLEDYPYLTYNDLSDMQALLESMGRSRSAGSVQDRHCHPRNKSPGPHRSRNFPASSARRSIWSRCRS